MESLEKLREMINTADKALLDSFIQRMMISAEIGEYKKQHSLPILDEKREAEKLDSVAEYVGDELSDYARELYKTLFALSRRYQEEKNNTL